MRGISITISAERAKGQGVGTQNSLVFFEFALILATITTVGPHMGLSQPVLGPAATSIATLGCGKAGVRDPEIAQLVLERRHRYPDDCLVG